MQDYLKLCLRIINEQRKAVLRLWDNHLLFMCRIQESIGVQSIQDGKKYEKKQKKTQNEVIKEMFIEYLKQRKIEFTKKKIETVEINSHSINSNPIKANLNTKFEFLLDKLFIFKQIFFLLNFNKF